jgi:hypothetical protein
LIQRFEVWPPDLCRKSANESLELSRVWHCGAFFYAFGWDFGVLRGELFK